MGLCTRWLFVVLSLGAVRDVAAQNALTLFGTNASAGKLNLCELRTNGTSCLVLKAADGQGGTRTVTIPDIAGDWTVSGLETNNAFTGANTFAGTTKFQNNTWEVLDGSAVTRIVGTPTSAAIVGYDASSNQMYRLEHVTGTKGRLLLQNSSSGYVAVTISASHTSGNAYTLVWPTSLPGSSMFLQSDTSGNLSWASGGSYPASEGSYETNRDLTSGNLSDTTVVSSATANVYLFAVSCTASTTGSGSTTLGMKWTAEGTTQTLDLASCATTAKISVNQLIAIRPDSGTTIYARTTGTAGTGVARMSWTAVQQKP